jgi:hypothetical protein
MGPHDVVRPTRRCRRRAVHLKHHRGRIDRLRRYRGQPQPYDAAGVPSHRHGQFDSLPPQLDWVHTEHIQAGSIEDQVLPRPGRLQFSLRPFRSRSDIPVRAVVPVLSSADNPRLLRREPRQQVHSISQRDVQRWAIVEPREVCFHAGSTPRKSLWGWTGSLVANALSSPATRSLKPRRRIINSRCDP